MPSLGEKVRNLEAILASMEGGALVAFSGGTDSALLLAECHRVLGDGCLAVTADSPSIPRAELAEAVRFAAERGIPHRVIPTAELADPRYAQNGADRCYFCKGELFSSMHLLAEQLRKPWLLYGAVSDDLGDFRPGMQAAREAGARAPLLEAGFTKAEVRERSKLLGLCTWDKPSSACLASRFPVGTPITADWLNRVEEAEAFLKNNGFRQCRVRLISGSARIEVEAAELPRFIEPGVRAATAARLKELGFQFVTLDLEGFRSGSTSPVPEGLPAKQAQSPTLLACLKE